MQCLCIILCLGLPEGVVDAGLVGEEGLVGAGLDDGAVVENGDFVAEFAGGQAVADVDGGAVTDNFGKFLVDLGFRYRIQGSGWFVQNDKGSILIEGSCDSNFLGFPAGNAHSGFGVLLV